MTRTIDLLREHVKAVMSYKDLAERMDWPYYRVVKKLNEFEVLNEFEEKKIREILKEAK